jgi:hypothetical protein
MELEGSFSCSMIVIIINTFVYVKILSRFRGVWLQTGYGLDKLDLMTTIGDFHTTNHSTLTSYSAFASRCLVTALNNDYFTRRFLATNLNNGDSSASVVTHNCPVSIPQLNCSANCLRTDHAENTALLLLWGVFTVPLHSNGCGRYLATGETFLRTTRCHSQCRENSK